MHDAAFCERALLKAITDIAGNPWAFAKRLLKWQKNCLGSLFTNNVTKRSGHLSALFVSLLPLSVVAVP